MIFSPERNRYSFSSYSDGPGFGAPDPVEPGPLRWPIEVKQNHPSRGSFAMAASYDTV